VGVARNQKRHFFLDVEPIEQDDLFCRRTEQVTRLKAQAEGGTGNLGDENVALLQPCHVAKINVPWTNQSVRLPGVIIYQMTGEHVMPISSSKLTTRRATSNVDRSPATVKPK